MDRFKIPALTQWFPLGCEIHEGIELGLKDLSPYFKMFMGPRNSFLNSASLCSLAGRYDNPIPPRFLAPIDILKIPALIGSTGKWYSMVLSFPSSMVADRQ
jgi:hypothetical protein